MLKSELNKAFHSFSVRMVFLVMLAISIAENIDVFYFTKIVHFYGNIHPAQASILSAPNNIRFDLLLIYALPVLLIFAYCCKSVQEKKLGLNNIYVLKYGRKKLLITRFTTAFVVGFSIFFAVLVINLFLNMVIMPGGTDFLGEETQPKEVLGAFEYFQIHHPYLSYFYFIILSSFTTGLLAVVCQAFSYFFRDNKLSLLFSVAVWLLFFQDYPIMVGDAYSPFRMEVTIKSSLSSLGDFVVLALVPSLVLVLILQRSRKDEI